MRCAVMRIEWICPPSGQVMPYFSVLMLLEAVVRWAQGKAWPRLNDTLSSVTAGLMMILVKLLTKSIEIM